ncbi:MAG: DUF2164 domain-containing protein [Parvibaculaceae bacterium]|nr:DUF2164 domain-containing protein [Parvibaculaceae bacterium]
MEKIKFSKEEMSTIIRRIQDYFDEELESDIGQMQAEFLLNFFSEEIGAYHYNRGLYDAQALLLKKVDDFTDSIYALEQRTQFNKK